MLDDVMDRKFPRGPLSTTSSSESKDETCVKSRKTLNVCTSLAGLRPIDSVQLVPRVKHLTISHRLLGSKSILATVDASVANRGTTVYDFYILQVVAKTMNDDSYSLLPILLIKWRLEAL